MFKKWYFAANNVWFKKTLTNHSSNAVLQFVQVFLNQMLYAWFIKFIALQVPWIFNFHTIPKDQFILKCKGFALFNLHNLKALWIIFTLHYICKVLKRNLWTTYWYSISLYSEDLQNLPVFQESFKIDNRLCWIKNWCATWWYSLALKSHLVVYFDTKVPPCCNFWN